MVKMTMKMAGVSTITLLLLCCSFITSTASQDKCDHNAATGSNFTVPLNHKLTSSQTLKWKHGVNIIFYRAKGNTTVVGHKENISPNGSLILTKLNKTYSGKYTPEVFENGKSLSPKSITLCVLDPVTKPKVSAICPKATSSKVKNQVTFTCESGQDGNIEWIKNRKVLPEKTKTLTQDAEKVATDSFSCKVSNKVSSMTSDPVIQNCLKSTYSFFFDEVMGVQIWIIIACGGGVVVLLILIVIVCCIMNRRKRRMNLKDEEELRLHWSNTQEQHHQHQHQHQHKHHQHNHPPDHHHHHQQQPAGHTGPRQHRSKQHREQRPRAPEPPPGHPQPSPRRPAQDPGPGVKNDEEKPPPLPQPRRQGPKTTRGGVMNMTSPNLSYAN